VGIRGGATKCTVLLIVFVVFSASEMTYIVSRGALNSTNSTHSLYFLIKFSTIVTHEAKYWRAAQTNLYRSYNAPKETNSIKYDYTECEGITVPAIPRHFCFEVFHNIASQNYFDEAIWRNNRCYVWAYVI